ncbi:hypothetical protein JCM16303_004811 [Sporobolomyces ruberrimus]
MQLRERKVYTARDEDDVPLQPQILDRQEQQEQVDELVTLANNSLLLHRNAVTALQAILFLVLLIKSGMSPFAGFLAFAVLPLSMARAILEIPAKPTLSPAPFNLVLFVPPLLYTLYLVLVAKRAEWDEILLSGFAPLGAILLRVGTEWEGARAIIEAKGLDRLMYDSPEA